MKKKTFILPLVVLFILSACQAPQQKSSTSDETSSAQFAAYASKTVPDDFNQYWYAGEAEISSYRLSQARYGEIHEGHAVLVYVTEDFSRKKQVKLDYAAAAGSDKLPILKLNFSKKFNTGIYPYSIMQSTFTPVDLDKDGLSPKATMSMQEWCGHVFTQLNRKKDHISLQGFSYFESEGDVQEKLDNVLLEDELWNRIRLNPANLPQGKQKLIPSLSYSRLSHQALQAQEAQLTLEEKGESRVYHIDFGQRSVHIEFGAAFPHKILGWEEKYRDGFGPNARELVTKGTLMESIKSDYWTKHNVVDLPMRKKLGL